MNDRIDVYGWIIISIGFLSLVRAWLYTNYNLQRKGIASQTFFQFYIDFLKLSGTSKGATIYFWWIPITSKVEKRNISQIKLAHNFCVSVIYTLIICLVCLYLFKG